ncbi:MAG: N-acetyl-gamma-glutamyl-phosphate reductase [Roseiflexus sp.]|nr:N-acetyl-gamma-glutamyl-phosphate reductase [Roseiflexus sp.]MCS7290827.1 N-acetyl-gamma-glutamyl-phosphate reductase [Roseiflexus sp.]MDW8146347.1 N-acetyl-gamma-glutamyl-phosphate reductase [Roseiflexaceae bacterium]MDW8234115.1 N-acetyl-gamma-glutamyl-phosphate reductase [Roseiflexaceae bacterium]
MSVCVSIVGGSGYVGGELLRLLLFHPQVTVAQATSERLAGKPITSAHPNLRGVPAARELQFTSQDRLAPCDLLILALPHGDAARAIDRFAGLAPKIIDCSADFRLRDPAMYARWYGENHPAPHWLERFVYGLPELHRDAIRSARYVSGVGCNATAAILALLPLARAGLIDPGRDVIVEVKVGSSEGGAQPSESSHHPERSGAVRSFAPVGHRHTAEVIQELGVDRVHLSITSVELVRGALATAHAFASGPVSDKDLWRAFRAVYSNEPFVRIVREKQGVYRLPEPKILAGSNYADVGFAVDEETGRIVTICAIDNLMKGAAGSAVQCLNLMCGFDERMGLEFPGLHPI